MVLDPQPVPQTSARGNQMAAGPRDRETDVPVLVQVQVQVQVPDDDQEGPTDRDDGSLLPRLIPSAWPRARAPRKVSVLSVTRPATLGHGRSSGCRVRGSRAPWSCQPRS